MRIKPGGHVFSPNRSVFIRSGAAVALSVLLGLGTCAQQSQAQGYYGSVYGITSTLLWPLRAAYPILYAPYSYRNPSYLARVLIQQGTRAALRNPPIKNQALQNAGADNYSDVGAVGGPQQMQKMKPFRYGQVGVDQIVSRYGKPEDQSDQAMLNRMPGVDGSAQGMPQTATPGTLTPQYMPGSTLQQPPLNAIPPEMAPNTAPQRIAAGSIPPMQQIPPQMQQIPPQMQIPSQMPGQMQQTALPPTAPPLVPNPYAMPQSGQAAQPPASSAASAAFPGHAPLANGFVETVNSQFNGDISKALFSPDTRAWARAVGVVSHDTVFDADLSSDRIDVIKKILKDDNLDAVSKLEAVRILLRGNSGKPSKKRR